MPAISMRAQKIGLASAVAVLAGAFATSTYAGPSPLTINLSVDGAPIAPIVDAGVPSGFVGDNRIEYSGSIATADYVIEWNFFGDVNPGEALGMFQGVSLSGDIVITNLTANAHDYELSAVLDMNASLMNAMYGGSYAVSTISSGEGGIPNPANRPDLELASLTGQNMYEAGINGGSAQSAFADPFSHSHAWGSADTIPATNYGGIPGAPNIAAPSNNITSLSHAFAFSLTGSTPDAGSPDDYDRVTFSVNLVVVPAPGAVALLGFAALAGRRRRRA